MRHLQHQTGRPMTQPDRRSHQAHLRCRVPATSHCPTPTNTVRENATTTKPRQRQAQQPNQHLQQRRTASAGPHACPESPQSLSDHLWPQSSEAALVVHRGRADRAPPLERGTRAHTVFRCRERPIYTPAGVQPATRDLLHAVMTWLGRYARPAPRGVTVSHAARR